MPGKYIENNNNNNNENWLGGKIKYILWNNYLVIKNNHKFWTIFIWKDRVTAFSLVSFQEKDILSPFISFYIYLQNGT